MLGLLVSVQFERLAFTAVFFGRFTGMFFRAEQFARLTVSEPLLHLEPPNTPGCEGEGRASFLRYKARYATDCETVQMYCAFL